MQYPRRHRVARFRRTCRKLFAKIQEGIEMTPLLEEQRIHLSNFRRFEKESNGDLPMWLDSLRHAGMYRFEQVGFPSPRDEYWRPTQLAPLVKTRFELASGGEAGDE